MRKTKPTFHTQPKGLRVTRKYDKKPKESDITLEDLESLEQHIEKYGFVNENAFLEKYPYETQIKMRSYLSIVKTLVGRETVRTDNLYELIKLSEGQEKNIQLKTSALSRSLRYIALFEDHPKPEDLNGIDLEQVYTYLSQVTAGGPPLKLTEKNEEFLKKAYLWLNAITKKSPQFDAIRETLKFINVISLVKKEPKEEEQDQSEEFNNIFNDRYFNPFKVDEKLLLISYDQFLQVKAKKQYSSVKNNN